MKMFERREMQAVWLGNVGTFHSTCCVGSHRHLGIPENGEGRVVMGLKVFVTILFVVLLNVCGFCF